VTPQSAIRNPQARGGSQGWIAVSGGGGNVQASVWRFGQQFPKSLAADEKGLKIGLFAATDAVPCFRPRFGEAKRHDVWFSFIQQTGDC
jgi:hypothetical protein